MRLEEIQPNATVQGILPDALVTVVSTQWFGSEPYSGSVQFCTTVSGEVLAWSLTVFIRNR